MPAFDREAAHVGGPFLPDLQRHVLARQAVRAPEREHRAADLLAGLAIGIVMGDVGRLSGAIVLASGVNAQRISERGTVVRDRAVIEGFALAALPCRREKI